MKKKKRSRVKEPSTWSSAAAIMASAAQLPIPGIQPWCLGLAGMMAAVGIYLREGEKQEAEPAE